MSHFGPSLGKQPLLSSLLPCPQVRRSSRQESPVSNRFMLTRIGSTERLPISEDSKESPFAVQRNVPTKARKSTPETRIDANPEGLAMTTNGNSELMKGAALHPRKA